MKVGHRLPGGSRLGSDPSGEAPAKGGRSAEAPPDVSVAAMTTRPVRPRALGPSAEDDLRFGSPLGDADRHYIRDDEAYARGELRRGAFAGDAYRGDQEGQSPYGYEAYEARLAASEKRSAETASRTAETLSSMAGWIERAQQQLNETVEAAGRLEEAARRRGPEPDEGSLGEALAAIRRIEHRLSAEEERRGAGGDPVDIEKTLRGFETRLGEVAERFSSIPRMTGRRPLKPVQIGAAVDEIRHRQTQLERDPLAQPRASGLPALGTLARSQTAMLTTLKDEVAKLAGRIEEIPLPGSQKQVELEVETLRRSMAEVARRDDLSRLEQGLQSLTDDILELRRAGERSGRGQEIAALQAEIRKLSEHRVGPDLAELQAEVRRLSEQRLQPVDIGPLARDIQGLSRKLDRVAEGGVDPSVIVSLSDQIEHMRQSLAEVATPRAFGAVDQQLSAIRREIADLGGRQVESRDLATLRGSIEDLRAGLNALAGAATSRDEVVHAVREFGQPIEATLAALVGKIERVERRISDPEALDHLERQIQMLAARMNDAPARDPAFAALERSMADILDQVSSWRDGAIQAAEHAARSAVAETIDAMPVAAEVERHLMEFGDRYAAAEERTRQSLATVQSSLSDVMARLSSLETEAPRSARPQGAAPVAPVAAPRAPEPPPLPRAATSMLPEADRPFAPAADSEFLLEPGASRPTVRGVGPGLARPPQPDAGVSAAEADIKSSFIAAARRAAQAAAADAQAGARPRAAAKSGDRAAMSPSEMVGRLRQMIDSKRRPLLLAAAAIVLAIGTMQIVLTQMGGSSPAPVAATAPAQPAAPRVASGPAADATDSRGDVTAATTPAPAPAPPADPVTTQSISPAPSSRVTASAEPMPPAATGVKEPARIAEGAPATPPAASAPARLANVGDPSLALPAGIRQAADHGNPIALYDLAARTVEGRGVARDPKAGTALFEKAAQKGLAPAQYRLGNSYERGIGVPRDIAQAKAWYRKAAEGGNVRAMHNLAVLLADGTGAEPDYPGAVQWFSRAAEHGVKDSQFNLAVLYARGLGTTQDFSRAYHWLAIAAQQGDEDAAKKRDEVGRRLSAADLARAKAGVERWSASPATVSANEVLVPPGGFPEPAAAAKRPAREARV